ncbi:YjcQ family protein [Clostridium sp.]|uniref:YjcQ family protein n=1 Tax=Clostridium TaxID=1485 RepID=UPI001C1DEB60|nr:YjcQ family protein [Clostridium sp.]MBU6137335.1 hypothetical protein [Clostridium tertium]HDO9489759.1 hypothetical protein [Clostridioides difficile]
MEISNFDYVLLSIFEEYTKDKYTEYERINQRELELETEEFIRILKELDNEGYISGLKFNGRGNFGVPWVDRIVLTDKGLLYISNIGKENHGNEIGYERTEKNTKISSLLKLAYDELKDVGTTVFAKVLKE